MTITATTYPLALGLIALALDVEVDDTLIQSIPDDARFDLRRDVEYYADQECSPDYAAPYGDDTYAKGVGWERSGDDDPIESEWAGGEVMVRAYRWDRFGVSLAELEVLADLNIWEAEYAEPLMGYLDFDGMHPAVSIHSDGMDWNMGGWTPVFMAVDYIVLN